MNKQEIRELGDIPYSPEGKLLMSALAIITTECRTDKTPYEVIHELNEHGKGLYPTDQPPSDEAIESIKQ